MIEVKIYTRQGCHLCEDVKAELLALQEQFPHKLTEIDIESSDALLRQYSLEIPVVEIGPYKLKAPITPTELAMTLAAALDRQRHIDQIDQAVYEGHTEGFSNQWTKSDAFSLWIARHYMAFFNLFVFLYVGLPFLAPVLMKAGAEPVARPIYRAYSFVCHQLAFRSHFLFGEQAVYPRTAAGIEGMLTFSQATGMSEGSSWEEIFAAERYVGDEKVGYKVALCQRDVAIYGGILLFGLLFVVSGRRLPMLPWYLWIALGLVPIGLDGVSQLISQLPIDIIPYRESVPELRIITGGLFGFMTAWFGYPMVEESMAETRLVMESKWRRIQRIQKKAS
jgi:uncharacterized membrane protein